MSDIPCTGIIGRMYDTFIPIAEWLTVTPPNKEVPRVVELYKHRNQLQIADVGCGGCADHFLLEEILKETLEENGITNPNISIVGYDNNEKLIQKVKSGEFVYSHFGETDHPNEEIVNKINKTAKKVFEQYEDGYKMKKDFVKKVKIKHGDIFNLPIEKDSQDIVICSYVIYHYHGKERQILKNLADIVASHGVIFTEGGFFNKKLKRIDKEEKAYREIGGKTYPIASGLYEHDYIMNKQLFDIVDKNRETYFMEKYNARAFPENRKLRQAQLDILKQYVDGGNAIEVMCGEGVLSLLALSNGIIDNVTFVDNNKYALKLLNNHVKSLGLEEKTQIINMDIEQQTPIGKFDYCFAICTEMFNPDYPIAVKVLRDRYIPPIPRDFLEKFSKVAKNIIVMEAYSDKEFEISPEQRIKKVAEKVELHAEVGKKDFGNGTLYYGVINGF
ncbi:MAG: methyltransferase domain-containing protein [Nanoarchaeota archaeon]|nr:methyltransferase domain-containing protein [Nanoarchaeota archaeon]